MVASLISVVHALADGAAAPAAGAAKQQSPGGIAGLMSGPVPLMLMMVLLFYFMLWRPQSKRQKETQEMLKALKKGDEVVTTGGLIGKITGMTDTTITLEVQEKVRLKVMRSHVTGKTTAAGGVSPQAAATPDAPK